MPLPPETEFPIAEAMKAMAALRNATGQGPELFPLPAVIGMLSDEIEACRKAGKTDEQIADLISHASAIKVDAATIAQFYAKPAHRHHS